MWALRREKRTKEESIPPSKLGQTQTPYLVSKSFSKHSEHSRFPVFVHRKLQIKLSQQRFLNAHILHYWYWFTVGLITCITQAGTWAWYASAWKPTCPLLSAAGALVLFHQIFAPSCLYWELLTAAAFVKSTIKVSLGKIFVKGTSIILYPGL